jgi:ribosomal protein L29
MKAADVRELRDLSEEELNVKLKDYKKELFNLRFQHAINQLDNPMRLNAVKKDIARVKTILREQELENSETA